jgi:hypothetical protein
MNMIFSTQADKKGLPCFAEVASVVERYILEQVGFQTVSVASMFGVELFILKRMPASGT